MKTNTTYLIIAVALSVASINATGAAASAHDRWEDSLTLIINNSRTLQLPLEPIENKIREGRAKNRSAAEIYPVVKTRQKHLLQIRHNQHGALPQEYTRQLFDLERSNTPAVQIAPHHIKPSPQPHQPVPAAVVKTASVNKSVPVESVSAKKITEPPTPAQGNGSAQKAQRQMVKADKKADKTLEKATTRAEQRMKAVEKQMQKRAMKRQGGGK